MTAKNTKKNRPTKKHLKKEPRNFWRRALITAASFSEFQWLSSRASSRAAL
jgi:hypothetical protein